MAKAKSNKGSGVNSAAIEQVWTASLIPYARNARTHSEQQVQQIAGSIQEFGFCNPVLIDSTNGIIAGHGRVMAAQLLKLETVPCLRLSHLTEAQKRAYVIADNQIALNSGWDVGQLETELNELLETCDISDANLRHMFSNMQSAIDSPADQQETPATQTQVEAMELRPHEHYDFIIVLARDAMTWNNLCNELGITSQPLFGRKNTKYGISRAITAEKVIERIQNNHPKPQATESNPA